MRAIIMAGGEGSRLRPITCNMPKPLVPLCSRPALEYILELLADCGVTEASLSLMYLGQQIEKHFSEKHFAGIKLDFIYEASPLGTAGGAANALRSAWSTRDFPQGSTSPQTEDVIIISGDALCDFDLRKALDFHRQKGAAATIITKKVEDTREYGVVCKDDSGRVFGFSEKPSTARATSCLANTGIYILSPGVWELVPRGTKLDFANDVFPKMLEKEMPLFTYEESGYWCDIGDINTYLSCQRDMLRGEVKLSKPIPTVGGSYISPTAIIDPEAKIFPSSVICDGVFVGKNAKIVESVVLSGAYISEKATVSGAVVCSDARVQSGAGVYETAVIGEHSEIEQNASVPPGIKVWNNKKVLAGDTLSENLKNGYTGEKSIGENGFFGETGASISPVLAAKIGAAIGSLPIKSTHRRLQDGESTTPNIGVGYTGGAAAKALALAAGAGIMAAGGSFFSFGECFRTQFDFCMNKSGADYGLFIEVCGAEEALGKSDELSPLSADKAAFTKIIPVDSFGFSLPRGLERKLELAVNKNEFRQVSGERFGEETNLSALADMYEHNLLKELDKEVAFVAGAPRGTEAFVLKSTNPSIQAILDSLAEYLDPPDSKASFINELHISPDGRRLSALVFENSNSPRQNMAEPIPLADRKPVKTKYIPAQRLFAFLCDDVLSRGDDVAVPSGTSHIVDDIAKAYGQKVYRCFEVPCDEKEDGEARKAIVKNPFSRDGLLQAIMLLNLLVSHQMRLIDAIETVPELMSVNKLVPLRSNPADIMGIFDTPAKDSEGVTIYKRGGEVMIRPAKTGRSLLLFASCEKAEYAREIFADIEGKIEKFENGKIKTL